MSPDSPERLPAAVRQALERQPEQVRLCVQRLLSLGMAGTFCRYLASADEKALATFFDDLVKIDFDWLGEHRRKLPVAGRVVSDSSTVIQWVPGEPAIVPENEKAELAATGWQSLQRGEWAEVVFAGGAATRFQSSHGLPVSKGLYPVTPVRGKSFLELFCSQALAAGIKSGRLPLMLLLTSGATARDITEWRGRVAPQGFPRDAIIELPQAEHPRLDAEGNIIIDEHGHIVVTGDGHGGVFKALLRGQADELRRQGVRSLVMHNVDNAAAHPFDPVRLGFHRTRGFKMTLTTVERAGDEKVGLIGRHAQTGRVMVVEYSVCPEEARSAVGADGRPLFWLAHVNTNLVELDAIRADLPGTLYTGKRIVVSGKELLTSSLEMLNQHLAATLPANAVGVLLLNRQEFFLPTKSLRGDDSLEGTRAALSRAAGRRLQAAGAMLDETAVVEVDPCAGAIDCCGWRLGEGARFALAVRHGVDGRPVLGAGLQLEPGATLILESELPYGNLRYDPESRRVREDAASAGCISIGTGVRVRRGSVARLCAEKGKTIVVPDRAVL